jgi:hypothetical protein
MADPLKELMAESLKDLPRVRIVIMIKSEKMKSCSRPSTCLWRKAVVIWIVLDPEPPMLLR